MAVTWKEMDTEAKKFYTKSEYSFYDMARLLDELRTFMEKHIDVGPKKGYVGWGLDLRAKQYDNSMKIISELNYDTFAPIKQVGQNWTPTVDRTNMVRAIRDYIKSNNKAAAKKLGIPKKAAPIKSAVPEPSQHGGYWNTPTQYVAPSPAKSEPIATGNTNEMLKIANAVITELQYQNKTLTKFSSFGNDVHKASIQTYGKKQLAVAELRHFGQWEVPQGEDDDGDYDWKVPTDKTQQVVKKVLDGFRKKYPKYNITSSYEEKEWLTIQVGNK